MTININKNETKKVFFTLTPTLATPYYIFRFVSNDTSNVTLMGNVDVSTDASFQAFTFSEGSTYSTAGGFILNPGSYDYTIYETQYVNDLNIASASSILNTGLMNVLSNEYTFADYDEDYVYYDESVGLNVIGVTGPAGPTGATGPVGATGPTGQVFILDKFNNSNQEFSELADIILGTDRLIDTGIYTTSDKLITLKEVGDYLVMLSFSIEGIARTYRIKALKNDVEIFGATKLITLGEAESGSVALQFITRTTATAALKFTIEVLEGGSGTIIGKTLDLSILKI